MTRRYAIRAANITAPGGAALLPSIFLHLPPNTTINATEGQDVVATAAAALVGSDDAAAESGDGAAKAASAAVRDGAATASKDVLLIGFTDRVGPDRGGEAVVALNGTTSAGRKYTAALVEDADGAVAASAGSWDLVLIVAEQQDRMQKGLALQAVAYTTQKNGDEDDLVLPAPADFSSLSLNAPVAAGDDASLVWTRDNAQIGDAGDAFYGVVAAGVEVGLLMTLPYDDDRSPADDAALVDDVAGRLLG